MVEPPRERLDQALVSRGLVPTRARARDLVLRGEVLVDGSPARKPAALIAPDVPVSLISGPADYVSRGFLKLTAALDEFALDPAGRVALDIGASTGGFTEALLIRGAAGVYAVENGRGQLHPRLAADPRVVSLEGTDARSLTSDVVREPVGAIVADVSFVSLSKVLSRALSLAAPGAWLAVLVKPQFELSPGQIPRDGIVKSEADRAEAVENVKRWIGTQPGWRILGVIPSPIHGGDGNIEFLAGAVLDG